MRKESRRLLADAFLLNALLSLSGGFLDAYTYVVRDHVLANTQTGNIVLLGMSVAAGNYHLCLRYLIPIMAFAAGAFLTSWVHEREKNPSLYWRKEMLVLEILVLFTVGFLSERWNMAANACVSFACGIQAQSFRKVGSYTYASTMCTGNLRSCFAALAQLLANRDRESGRHCLFMVGMLMTFLLGTGLGWWCSLGYSRRAVWIPCLLLTLVFSVMGRRRRALEADAIAPSGDVSMP